MIQAIELGQPQLGSNPREADFTQPFIKALESRTYFLSLKNTSSKNIGSFKDAVKGKGKAQVNPATNLVLLRPYIVEQKPENPALTIEMPEVKDLYSGLFSHSVIYRFNGYWPKSGDLHHWIHTTWTPNYEIYLFPKGFLIVRFNTEQEKEHILNKGPWFWGNARLYITPWFPNFDANTMVVLKVPVWVRLHNLPLHFWHHKVLIAIGNTLGKFLKIDSDRMAKGIFTFARICVEVDFSEGLLESIILNFNNTQWLKSLDYEETAFRCQGCLQTGHLLSACPQVRSPNWNKQQHRKLNTVPLDEEEDVPDTTDFKTKKDEQEI
eukprot:PITA_21779